MSATTVIQNLNQAVVCAGKCDCCDKLQQQINQINQKLANYVHKSEKPQIIQQSVASAEQLIIPGVLVLIANAVGLLKPEIQLATTVAKVASETAKTASAAAARFAPLLGVITALLSLAAAAGTLLVLGARIDALENGLDALGNDVSGALGQLFRVQQIATTAKDLATSAKQDVEDMSRFINKLAATIYAEVDRKINVFKSEITAFVNAKVYDLNNRINEVRIALKLEIDGLGSRMTRAESDIKQIAAKLNDVIKLVNDIQIYVREILREFLADVIGSLRFYIDEVKEIATRALDTAKLALSKTRNQADETEISSIKARIGVIENAIPKVRATAQKAIDIATAISASIPGTVTNIVNIVAPPIAQTTVQTFTPPLVQSLVPPLIGTLVPPLVGNLVPPLISGIKNQITNIINNITNITNIVNQPANIDLSGIERKIDAIPGSMIAAFIASPAVFERTKTAAKAGTCEASAPGGCIDVSMGRNNNNLFNKIANLFNTGANAAQLALLNVINTKLGKQISDAAGAAIGISGGLLRIGSNTVLDRLLNLMTFAATVHNATQLSSNIGITLIQAMQNVVDLFGLKDANGEAYNLSQLIGTSINSFVAAIIGEENLIGIKKEWAKYNRIYQAGANLFSTGLWTKKLEKSRQQ